MSISIRSISACSSISARDLQREMEAERGDGPCLRRVESAPDIEELPLMQQLAMLQMMHSTLARGIAKRLSRINDCQDRPSHFDYRALVAKGLAYRAEDDRWHTLTTEGWSYARPMLTRLCRQNNIHIIQEDRVKDSTCYRCSCGQWSTTLYGSPGMHQFRQAQQRFYAHLPAECKRAEIA